LARRRTICGVQAWLLTAVGVIVAMLGWAATVRVRRRISVDRHELDDLRRIYRRDNPRGPGLEPLIRDQQKAGLARSWRREDPTR
jgi:hypothetical protein